eukprot:CAMPEP_0198203200 /NCGR_PEP_ID=MMETSP1445-20131203/6455_1 /TAXON_ID=36898 /ORGANISM="Pyramimonas sp., Strain CCMP2087" /LENGTH=30 /DNA_ID= /DNA_START= /DNA_END= /DNA_ORIENTATION=
MYRDVLAVSSTRMHYLNHSSHNDDKCRDPG